MAGRIYLLNDNGCSRPSFEPLMPSTLSDKLHPTQFSEMSPLMGAIVGYVLGESFTEPTIAELTVSEQENLVYIRQEGAAGFEGIQSLTDLRNNWNRLLDAAELTDEERKEAVRLFNERVEKLPGTEV
jgi:hypothetical protein